MSPPGYPAAWLRLRSARFRFARQAQTKTTLGLYTQEDRDETQAAQGEFLAALGMKSGQSNESVGWIMG